MSGQAGQRRLLVVVGPSGVGKDSLLSAWRRQLAARGDAPRVHVVRRTITRPAQAGGEDHEAVTPAAFGTLSRQGAFALQWQAHGLSYGVRHAELAPLAQAGRWVLLNGSRAALDDLRARWPGARVVEVHAQPATVAARLHARGREDAAAVAARLARSVPVDADLRVANDGPLAEAVAALDGWWRRESAALSAAA